MSQATCSRYGRAGTVTVVHRGAESDGADPLADGTYLKSVHHYDDAMNLVASEHSEWRDGAMHVVSSWRLDRDGPRTPPTL